MKKLIVNADDFGFNGETNKGIIYAHQNGVVTSASLFVEKDGTEDALRLVRENPTLGLGPHVDLDQFFEVDHHMGIVIGLREPEPDTEAIRGEVRRQLDKYRSYGLSADHLDSHHHAHLHARVFPLFCEIGKEYGIPVIRFAPQFCTDGTEASELKQTIVRHDLTVIDHFIEGWYWGNVDEPYQLAELMTHPGYGELWREAELAHCCQPQLKQYLVDQNIDLLRFSDIVSR